MISAKFTQEEMQSLSTAIRFIRNNRTRTINESTKSALDKSEAKTQSAEFQIKYTPDEAQGFLSALSFLKNNPSKSCWNPAVESVYQKLKNGLDAHKQSQPKMLEVEIL